MHLEVHLRASSLGSTLDFEISAQSVGSLPHPPYPQPTTSGESLFGFLLLCHIEAYAIVFYLGPELLLADPHSNSYMLSPRVAPDVGKSFPKDAQQLPAPLSKGSRKYPVVHLIGYV